MASALTVNTVILHKEKTIHRRTLTTREYPEDSFHYITTLYLNRYGACIAAHKTCKPSRQDSCQAAFQAHQT
ncbi:hypothetical protein IV203_023152 [Nitzschia inconspicua]|uniref:Uncharacterized protein n=1 Tax=Nitzschia inconspicua TaxID=303405 RepID=A0A9K3PBZ3_9STRA|nr:hypothetical protein IV203_023152 [Nitzschia inconspicua]